MDKMRAEGAKDVDISFVGMAFIIDGALAVIHEAVASGKRLAKPATASWMSPWKGAGDEVTGLEERIKALLDSLLKYNGQLLEAISIASHALNIENLENALTAANVIDNFAVR